MMNSSTGEPRRRCNDAAATGGPAVEARGLTVRLGTTLALDDLDLVLPRGGITGLLGPSGSGKTTLMRTIVGVQRPTSGDVRVFGGHPGDLATRAATGYVTQATSVYTDLSVHENVRYFASLAGVDRAQVDEAIAAVGLATSARRRVDTLSGGQASRVSLACALVGDPALLVLDEPTVGLDPLTRADIWRNLRALADRGVTMLVSSHVLDEAARCDRVLLLRNGRLLADASPAELLRSTGAPDFDAAFLYLIRADAPASREEVR